MVAYLQLTCVGIGAGFDNVTVSSFQCRFMDSMSLTEAVQIQGHGKAGSGGSADPPKLTPL